MKLKFPNNNRTTHANILPNLPGTPQNSTLTGGERKSKAKATSSFILWPPNQSKHSKHHKTSQRKIWKMNGNQCVKVMCEETRKYKFIGI